VEIIEVQVWDHSKLGGPMGTEDVSLERSLLFATEAKAIKWAIGYVRRKYKHVYEGTNLENLSKKRIKKILADTGPIGITFNKKKIR
jgi:hypothetical protein